MAIDVNIANMAMKSITHRVQILSADQVFFFLFLDKIFKFK